MKVVAMTVPGRFPTVVVDPGNWWSPVAANQTHTLSRFSANAAWWRLVCDPDVGGLLYKGLNWKQRLRRRLEWTAAGINLTESGRRAAESLEALCQWDAYTDADSYISAVNPLAEHLDALNRAQDELEFGFEFGVRVRGLNYADSAALVGYAKTDTLLSALVTAALAECPDAIQFLVLSVTSPEDLLCASIVVGALREAEPAMHACLADHGYENFSLQAHIPELHKSGQLTTVFDTLIVSKDDRDALVPQLIEEVDVGKDPHGFVTAGTRTLLPTAVPPSPIAPPPEPTFTPEPVFWTRVSKRRCYWSRCAFCVQNTKYESPESPSLAELPAKLDRLEALATAGYRNFIFSDEALSPTLLERLSRSIVQRGLTLRWACRSKLELAHTRYRFDLMKQAGCYEVLFGLESISPRIQKRMDKYTEGLDKERIRQILWDLNAAGITTVLQAEWTTERTTRKLLNQETGDANAKRGNRTGVMSFGPDPGFRGV